MEEFETERKAGRSFGETVFEETSNLGFGILKGMGFTLYGTAQLGEKFADKLGIKEPVKKALGIKELPKEKPKILEPKGLSQKIGYYGEKIAEFLLPSSKIAALEAGKPLIARAAIEETFTVGVTALQTGGDEDDIKTAAIIGALIPGGGAAIKEGKKLLGKSLIRAGEKIQYTVIKPSLSDVKDGFKIENVFKYNVGGSLNDTLLKTSIRMNMLTKQLHNMLGH